MNCKPKYLRPTLSGKMLFAQLLRFSLCLYLETLSSCLYESSLFFSCNCFPCFSKGITSIPIILIELLCSVIFLSSCVFEILYDLSFGSSSIFIMLTWIHSPSSFNTGQMKDLKLAEMSLIRTSASSQTSSTGRSHRLERPITQIFFLASGKLLTLWSRYVF